MNMFVQLCKYINMTESSEKENKRSNKMLQKDVYIKIQMEIINTQLVLQDNTTL